MASRFHPLMVMIASVRFTNSSSEKLFPAPVMTPPTLDIRFKNTCREDLYVTITGLDLDHNNQWFLLKADGKSAYHPKKPSRIGSPLEEDCTIKIWDWELGELDGRPALLHLRTVRFLGHAGTDVESSCRSPPG